jgi:hypothetical protein
VRRLTLLAILAVAGCGGGDRGLARADAVAAANRICENTSVPAIPARVPLRRQARFAELAARQESQEAHALAAVDWDDPAYRQAVRISARAARHLAAFSRAAAHGASRRAAHERAVYDALLDGWRALAGSLGLDVCRQFGWVY